MPRRYEDWFRQAQRDINHARNALEDGDYDWAKELDKQYIPSRSPNSFDEGAPLDYYTKDEATRSIGHAQAIITFCKGHIHQPRTDPQSPGESNPGVDP